MTFDKHYNDIASIKRVLEHVKTLENKPPRAADSAPSANASYDAALLLCMSNEADRAKADAINAIEAIQEKLERVRRSIVRGSLPDAAPSGTALAEALGRYRVAREVCMLLVKS